MKINKIILVLLFSMLPLTMAAGDNWILYFSDGATTINGTDVCVSTGQCLSDAANASGDITAVNTNGNYLYGGSTTGAVSLLLNETYLNATISSLATNNASWNQTLADSLYASISVTGDNSSWNQTLADTLYATIGAGNASFNQTLTDSLYIAQSDEGNLDVNSSDYWDDYNTINGTQFENNGGTLSIVVSWFSTLFDNLFGAKNTDDLTEGSTNLYQNKSFNESHTDTLYADISVTGGNSSFNETYTDTLYYDISNSYNFWNDTYATFNKTYGDTLYASISVTGDNSSFNETYTNTLYAIVGYGDDWNKTYADTLYAAAGSGNSSWNETHANTLYYDISNPYGFWNSTFALFNKTYADTLYASISVTGDNSSWNKTYADTLYAPINYGDDWNKTYADTLYATIGSVDNSSWNQTLATSLYSPIAEPLSLHINQDNWFNGSNGYNYWDGDSLEFNISKLQTTYFNATTVQAIRGTTSGTLPLIQSYDSVSYNVTEEAGAVGMDFRINFTGITEFNRIIFRYKSSAAESHVMNVQIYNYVDAVWEDYATLTNVPAYNMKEIGVYDTSDHISGGKVQVRFYSSANGNTGHKHQFDWVNIAQGLATPAGTEVDPYSIHRDGTTKLTANWNQSFYNLTSTKSWFLGKVNWSSIQNAPAIGSDNSSWNESYANTLYSNDTDTNETSFVNNLTLTDCSAGNLVIGIQDNGTVLCAEDSGNVYTSNLNFTNDANYWNDTYATFNKTYADTLYSDTNETSFVNNLTLTDCSAGNLVIGVQSNGTVLCATDAGNSSFNQSLTNSLYRLQSWDNITGIPHATPSDGDTTHFSLADEIYDWVIGLLYATTSYVDSLGNYSAENSTIARIGDCPAGQFVQNTTTGGVECLAPTLSESDPYWTANQSSYSTTAVIFGFNYWNDTYATFNKTHADTLYADINSVDTNASTACDATEVLLGNGTCYNSTLFYDGAGNESWTQALADTLYYGVANIWGFYNSTDFSITDYFTKVQIVAFDYFNLTNFPYTHLSNFTNDLGIENYSHLSNFTDDLGDRGYTSNLNFTNDASFWNDTYATFNKTYADTLYASISVTGDNSSWNKTYADTIYAVIGYGDDWNKTYADTLYADISVTGDNSSWNETYADTLYYDISNPSTFWNATFALFNKTYADTLYADIAVTGDNSSWNKTYADTLYASISVTGDNESWNETYATSIYAPINYGDDWNKTYADTLYAGIDVTGDNSSWNKTYADTLYYDLGNSYGYYNSTDFSITDYWTSAQVESFSFWNDTYATFNKTYADTLYAEIGAGNSSWNESYADGLYLLQSNEGNLDVNSSDYWDDYNTANTTWFQNIAGALSLKLTQLTIWVDAWLGTKNTDDLTEGTTNLYQNKSFNETHTDTLYADINLVDTNASTACSTTEVLLGNGTCYNSTLFYDGAGNASWTQSLADTLYYDIGNSYGYYNSTNQQPVSNYTEDEIEAFIFDNDNTANFNMSGYNITMDGGKIYSNSSCVKIVGDTSILEIC